VLWYDGVRVSYLLRFLCYGRMGNVFLIFLVFFFWLDGGRVSYLLSFLYCGRMGCVFIIFLVFCVVVG
jgi:hypothetical protein